MREHSKTQTIEVNVGVGMDQLFPQTTTIEISLDIYNKEYENYLKYTDSLEEPDWTVHVDDPNQNCVRVMTKQEFIIQMCDEAFSARWTKKSRK